MWRGPPTRQNPGKTGVTPGRWSRQPRSRRSATALSEPLVVIDLMFDTVCDVRTSLEKLACQYQPALLDGPAALRLMAQLAIIRRLTDGLIARTARRIDETKACEQRGERDGANTCAALLGGSVGEARQL